MSIESKPRHADPKDLARRRDMIAAKLFAQRREPTKIGRYTLLRQLGAGGMAVVYAAYDESLDRRVALKLLQTEGVEPDERRQLRLEREAKAMAQLAHPNVATVFEIGRHVGEEDEPVTFIAMEFIEGRSLRRWLAEERPRSELLSVFLQAGEGLVAAHDAGLVHRDFKPDNVMVRTDGVAKVLDFGVAAWRHMPGDTSFDEEGATTPDDVESLTATGNVPGTPAYMAPEQLEGRSADARSDQFAFCVTLVEALVGQRPFRGSTLRELADAMKRPPDLSASGLPRHLQRALKRGLAFEPDARFASMRGLLRELRADPARRRRRVAVGLGLGLGAVAAAGFVLTRVDQTAPCEQGDLRAEAQWSEARRAEIAAAFERTGLPFASSTWTRMDAALDDWITTWATQRDEACEATRVHATQSEALLDLRVACLDRAWAGTAALLEQLEQADTEAVVQGPSAVADLPDLARCADTESLLERERLPDDPAERAAIAELDADAAALRAELDLGHVVVTEARNLVERARTHDHAPTMARALLVLGRAAGDAGDETVAVDALKEGLTQAQATADPTLFTETALVLAERLSASRDAHDSAQDYLALADGAIRREGDPPRLRGRWHSIRGLVLRNAGSYADSIEEYEAALRVYESEPGAFATRAAATRGQLGILSKDLGKPEEGLPPLEELLAQHERELGADHPTTCLVRNKIASVLIPMGRYDEAQEHLVACIECLEAVWGPDHVELAVPIGNLASIRLQLGAIDEAAELVQRQHALIVAERGEGTSGEAHALNVLASIQHRRGQMDEALEAIDRAIAITKERKGPLARPLVFHNFLRGQVLLRLGRMDESFDAYGEVLRILQTNDSHEEPLAASALMMQGYIVGQRDGPEAALPLTQQVVDRFDAIHHGEPHMQTVTALNSLAQTQAVAGREEEALATFERALTMLETASVRGVAREQTLATQGTTRFGLAQLLWDEPGQRQRATTLAKEAKASFERFDEPRHFLVEVDAWLEERGLL